MKFSQITTSELDPGLLTQWQQLQSVSTVYRSPYYHPQYSQIIADARPDVRILVIEDAGQVIGFFPYHKTNRFRADVIGGGLTDYQGPICSFQYHLPVGEMLKAMGVAYMGFNHMPQERHDFSACAWSHSRSLTLNLEGGFAAYAQRLNDKRDASLLKKVETNERKLARKFGALSFTMDSRSATEFDALLAGKSAQFTRTLSAEHDIFATPWIRDVVYGIFSQHNTDFGGILSSLYAGDKMIAAHFGMRSGPILHYWFPWYDTDYAEFSPGLILLASCTREAQAHQIELIDLGRGEQAYKQRFATGFIPLCEGAVSAPAVISKAQGAYLSARAHLKESNLGKMIRAWKNAKK